MCGSLKVMFNCIFARGGGGATRVKYNADCSQTNKGSGTNGFNSCFSVVSVRLRSIEVS